MTPRVFVRRAKSRSGRRPWFYWNVYDCRSSKFIRQFTYESFATAIHNADRISRGERVFNFALIGFQRIEYGGHQDPTRSSATHLPRGRTVSEEAFCTYQWDGNPQEPGVCQCMRTGGHESPHRCCCGQEADL